MKKKDNQTPPTPAELAAMSPAERETWEERGFTLGPVAEGRTILNPPPGMIASLALWRTAVGFLPISPWISIIGFGSLPTLSGYREP